MSTGSAGRAGAGDAYRGLVDDAAIFPPGNAPLPEAVAAHLRHRRAAYADYVGGFVAGEAALTDLAAQLAEHPGAGPLAVNLVVSGGAGALESAVRWATRAEQVGLRAVEVALRDETDLAHNARRMTTMVDQLRVSGELGEDTPVFVEPPRLYDEAATPSASWLAALDEVAAAGLALKFRTGGLSAEAFPGTAELAAYIDAALDRELAFKCTAGLHRAVRHRAAGTGFCHHGFLNVLLATRVSLDGGDPEEAAAALEDPDPAAGVRALDGAALASTRRWFTSFGSCSVLEPLADLVDLALVPHLDLESA